MLLYLHLLCGELQTEHPVYVHLPTCLTVLVLATLVRSTPFN